MIAIYFRFLAMIHNILYQILFTLSKELNEILLVMIVILFYFILLNFCGNNCSAVIRQILNSTITEY